MSGDGVSGMDNDFVVISPPGLVDTGGGIESALMFPKVGPGTWARCCAMTLGRRGGDPGCGQHPRLASVSDLRKSPPLGPPEPGSVKGLSGSGGCHSKL